MKTPKEYRAEIMKISGFGLMTPIGSLIVNIVNDNITIFSMRTFLALIFSIFLFYMGGIIIVRGLEIIEGKN